MAGCDACEGSGNKCRAALQARACDICPMLNDSSPPRVFLSPIDTYGATNVRIHRRGGKVWYTVDDIQIDKALCSRPQYKHELAVTMLHEAVHACAPTAGHIFSDDDSDPNSAPNIEKECTQ